MHLYWPTRTVTDGRWKLIHHLFGDGKRKRYHGRNHALFSLNKQVEETPVRSLARKLRHRSEVPPAYELYDLQNDPDEQRNLFGNAKHATVQERLMTQLESWRRESSDPFVDPTFVTRFTESYRRNHELWESLGGHKMKDKTALDFKEFISAWGPAPYIGKKDR